MLSVLMLLLLLPYPFNAQALSATTANTIQGTAPYLTFDGGTTKVTTTDSLLSITLSDTTTTPATNTTITASGNTSTAASPYVLPVAGQTFADVGMLVPTTANTIGLNALIGAPYNYWGDDDGDGRGASGVSVTGNLSVAITDRDNQAVNRSDSLDICNAPYKLVLTSTAGTLNTQYGAPNSSSFTASNVTYYINPKSPPKVCFAKPSMITATNQYAGPASMWNTTKGFIPQSTTPATYGSNFPTTGANGLYFDLAIGGMSTPLTWPTVTGGEVTATMTPSSDGKTVRVLLTGPTGGFTISTPWPNPFELIGSDGTTTVKYGFSLRKWYVQNGGTKAPASTHAAWCASMGYRQSMIQDLTNASTGVWIGASPPSGVNSYSRTIGAGLFSEWGAMSEYKGLGWVNSWYLTSEVVDAYSRWGVSSTGGSVSAVYSIGNNYFGICTYP